MPAYSYPHSIDNGNGETITFLGRSQGPDGERLEVTNVVKPGIGPVMHVHHHQEEALTVVKGRIGYQRLGQPEAFAGPGDTVTFPPGDAHRFWNAGDDDLVCRGYISPADNIEYFLGEIFDSQKRAGSMRPNVFEAAYLTRHFKSEFAMVEIPAPVQRYVFPVLIAIGNALGKFKRYASAPAAVVR